MIYKDLVVIIEKLVFIFCFFLDVYFFLYWGLVVYFVILEEFENI